MNQEEIVKRIESICKEFDSRVEVVGLAIARLELAKALAEEESDSSFLRARVAEQERSEQERRIEELEKLLNEATWHLNPKNTDMYSGPELRDRIFAALKKEE